MASCTQIDHQIQSYLDGELLLSDRAILEQHLAECPDCVRVLRQHQWSNASLFEVYAPVRLKRDLTEYVLSHLPEMEPLAVDVQQLNRRAKHPTPWRERLFRLMPLGVAALLLVLGAFITARWPEPAAPSDTIGMVAALAGKAERFAAGTGLSSRIRERIWIQPGDRIVTEPDGKLSLLTIGPSELRLAEDTSVKINSDRRITIDRGRVYLDIAKSQRLFKVVTPVGDVTVFGTRFEVFVEPSRTTVTVAEGKVHLSHHEDASVFRMIVANQRAFIAAGQRVVPLEVVDAEAELAWANEITANEVTRSVFEQQVQPGFEMRQVPGEGGYFLQTNGRPLKSLHVTWKNTSPFTRYSDYDILVYAPDSSAIFSTRLPGSIFNNLQMSEFEIPNTGNTETGYPTVYVKLVPVDPIMMRQVEFETVNGNL